MAIEPLGSVMSIQTQTVQKTEQNLSADAGTEAGSQVNSKMTVDATTAAVAQTESRQDGSAKDEKQAQYQHSKPSTEQIRQAVEKLNKSMSNSEAVFGIHDATNRVTIKIIDRDTKKVIKELPPEKTLDMIAKVWEMAGILVDEKR